MFSANRRRFLQFLTATTGLTLTSPLWVSNSPAFSQSQNQQLGKLTIGGSPIVITVLLAYLSEQAQIQALAQEVDLSIWKTHDQLRAEVVSNQLQISATPTSLAANLYQRGVPIKLLNVLVWGVLNLWSGDENISSWQDLRGKKLLIPFRGGLPAQLFFYLASENGLNPEQELDIQYTTDFAQAVQLLLAGRGDAALLAEPAGTGAEIQGQNQGIPVQSVLNLQEEWGKATGREPRIPQAGTLALTSLIEKHPEVIEAVQTELINATTWATENPAEAAQLGAKYLGLKAPVIESSLAKTPLKMVTAVEAQEDLEFWFSRLMEKNPKLLGGKLPNAEFYYG
ncbi:ABC transporter substrate-binding protein [Hyella patelloides LEGE 07179]|uniref:ABC transporter substrate-binding protein n=1 Tax=Hyella patelloides LEGE 07179 TaxID=945734 RepID=A0A563W3W5_9CYAN|nr:ABC transporter substrate-binding protein [Hyella patelloides]VEP18366.1 ABC transporter substrate-binding protein [Hyella patelloides LEGE 07179]